MADHDTAGSVLTGYLGEQCDRVITLTTAGLADAETVHDTRIALRRLRSTLRSFADLFVTEEAAKLDREAQWLAGLLGELRDRDVLADRIADHADLAPELSAKQVRPVLRELADQRDAARRTAIEALRSDRYADLIAVITWWRDRPPLTAEADQPAGVIADRVRRAGRQERRRVRQAIKTGAHDEDLHRARKAAKRHRYALELEALAGTAKGERSKKKRQKRKRRAKRSRKLQRLLGRHQDAVVAARFLVSGLTADPGAKQAEARRRLLRRERAIAEKLRPRLRADHG
ncbi:CHAD domain-containing protein [Microlunatus speluncae]|uniref:CHAD domain-containing protein n=1 Tax=Microlunatus speluncae TaxID=2594267 RepID=UPI001266194D|nr:CHAD domain-containing protein [Microlunatus speluncae]